MLLRLWYTLATGLARPRLGLLDECAVTLRVWPNDLDSNFHMTNSRYLLAMDVVRWDFGLRTGMTRQLWRRRWFPLVGSATLRFRRGLDPFQRYSLGTRLVAWDEKWCWFEQRFSVDGALYAVGRVKVVFRGPDGNVPTGELSAACGLPDAPARQLPESIRLWQEAEERERSNRSKRRPTGAAAGCADPPSCRVQPRSAPSRTSALG